jgi:hypothetical protein
VANRSSGGEGQYGRSRCLRRHSCGAVAGYDHRYAAADEIGDERRQPIVLIFRPAIFDRDVLPVDIAGFLQALEKRNRFVLVIVISGLIAEIPKAIARA